MKKIKYPDTDYNLPIMTTLKINMGNLLEQINESVDSNIWDYMDEEHNIDLKDEQVDNLKIIVLQKLLDLYK